MPNTAPVLADSLTAVLLDSLESTGDNWIRAEISTDFPIREALERLRDSEENLRVGTLRPFEASVAEGLAEVTDSAIKMTDWRNRLHESSPPAPTIILGDALDSDEAGLRRASRVVIDSLVLDHWQNALQEWFEANVNARPAQQLLSELFVFAVTGLIDPRALDDYIQVVCSDESEVLSRMRTELWRLNLLEDELLLDDPRGRILRNLDVKRLLVAAPDSPSDARRLQRLQREADEGNALAKKALKYRESFSREDLAGVSLGELEALLRNQPKDPPPKPKPPGKRQLNLTQFLDITEQIGAEPAARVLKGLEEEFIEALKEDEAEEDISGEPVVLQAALDDDEGDVVVQVRPTAGGEHPWVGNGSPEEQTMWFLVQPDAVRAWPSSQEQGLRGSEFLDVARNQDLVVGTSKFEQVVSEYLVARANFNKYEKWFRWSEFEILLLSSDARRVVREFLAAWENLVDTVSEVELEDAGDLRTHVALLEACWGGEPDRQDTLEACVLGPLHPFVLLPRLRLADYALESIGDPELGQKVQWGLDRSMPAYRAIWAPGTTLVLAKEGDVFEYRHPSESRHHPPANSGDGLTQVVKAFIGYHPFAKGALVLTFVDPPKGGAVVRGVTNVRTTLSESLRVYSLSTGGDSSRLDESGDLVHDLGRRASVADWADKTHIRSHIVFVFVEHSGGAPVSSSEKGATRGAHLAPTIRFGTQSLLSSKISPYVTFDPREDNSVVIKLRGVLAAGGETKLFEMSPLLTEEQTQALAKLRETADWVVIAAPAPLGLVVPTELAEGLVYLGREELGAYGLFVFATDRFPIRRAVLEGLRKSAVEPDPLQIEERLMDLALRSPNGVLRIGRATDNVLWPQIGELLASSLAETIDGRLNG